MDLMELLRRMQAPAVDTETGYYDTYQPDNMNYIIGSSTGELRRGPYIYGSSTGKVRKGPYINPKIKQVITETDDDKPNKRVTTIDYPQVDTRELGSLSMGPLSMMAAERIGYDPMLMQSEEKISMDELYTDTIGNLSREEIIEQGLRNVADIGLMEGAEYGPGAVAGMVRQGPRVIGKLEKALIDRGYMNPRYVGASRAGEPIKGIDPLTGKWKTVISKRAGEFAQEPSLTAKGKTALGIGAGAGLVGLSGGEFIGLPGMNISPTTVVDAISNVQPNQLVDEIPTDAYEPAVVEAPVSPPSEPVGNNLDEANKKIVAGLGQADPVKYEILQSMYGKYARDPKARKQQYLDQISKIYRNAMILNAIAQLTGGRSQASMYVKMATDKLDAIEKFDNEERMHGIWKDVFFDQSGQFRSPTNWQETYNAAIKLGATPEEAKELADTTFGAGGGKTTAAMQNFAWYNGLTGAEKELAARILKIDQNNVGTLSPSKLVDLINSQAFLEFDKDEQRRVIAIIKKLIPGFESNVNNSDVSNPQQKESGNDKGLEAARKRAEELKNQGKSEEQIMQILRNEDLI